ncbi:Hypothetical predicted protein, partial [Pelobates cultripes]
MEAPLALQPPRQGGQPDQKLIRCKNLQSDPWRIAYQQLPGEDWSPTRMLIIPVPLPHPHRLDHEDIHQQTQNGIQWTLRSQLDDLNFADDLILFSHSQQQMQEKISMLAAKSAQVGLIIHKEKTKILKINFSNINPITLNGSPLEELQFFTYLGSIINQQGGTDADVK